MKLTVALVISRVISRVIFLVAPAAVAVALAAALVLPGTAAAQQGGASLEQAVQQVKRQGDVRVLSAETVKVNGRRVHRIKVLTGDGRVKYVRVDAGG